ncbi:MAG TPA: MFS transporter [Anaerolineaceae bacterium]|nr:MFS transporter [Anaerolineaceae bacterium]
MHNRKNIAILFFTMIVVMIGFGIIIPILPFYVESFGASGSALGMLMAIFSIMQFLFAPFWGRLSDQIGRKKVLLIGIFGNALTMLLFGLSTSLWMLFASRALSGILSSATLPVAMAFISDSTDRQTRGGGMGIIGAAMGVGMVLGPGLGGSVGESSLSLPFFIAAGLSVAAFLLVIAILPESLPPERRVRGQTLMQGPQFGMLWRSLFGPLGFLFFLSFLVHFALSNFEAIFGLYALHQFDFGPQRVGTILTVIGLVSAVAQGVLTGPVTRRWGDVPVIKTSLIVSAIGSGLLLLAYDYATVLLTVGFFVTGNAFLRPAITSFVSKQSDEGHGMMMGLVNSYMSLGRVVGPLWAGSMFDLNNALPYLSAGGVLLVSYFLSLRLLQGGGPVTETVEATPQVSSSD